MGLKETAVNVENVIVADKVDDKDAIRHKYLQSDLFNVTLKLRNGADSQRHLSTEHVEFPNETSVSTNKIASSISPIEDQVKELPNMGQAKPVHEPTLNVSKSTDSFEAIMRNENARSLPPPKAKLKHRGRGRGRGVGRGRKFLQIDPNQPKIDAFWKKKDTEKGGGSQ